MIKCMHTADFHIDNQNREEAKKCLDFIIKTTEEESPDIIMIAGDLFESRNVKLESPAAILLFDVVTKMANLAPVAIVYGTPSHEGTATAALRYLKAKHPIHVSDRPEQYYLMNDNRFAIAPGDRQPKLIVSAVPQPTKQYFKSSGSIDLANHEIASAMTVIFSGFGATAAQYNAPHILMGHFSVSGAFLNNTRQMVGLDIEISSDQIALANTSLTVLGHIHLQQKIPGNHNIFYSGSIFQKDFGEAGEDKGFYIHQIEGKKLTESRFILTPSRKRLRIKMDYTETSDSVNIDALFQANIGDIQGALVRCDIKVFQDEAVSLDADKIKKGVIEMGCDDAEINIIRIPRENTRSKTILSLEKLRDKIVERADLNHETVPESILAKADILERELSENIIKNLD